MSVIKHMESMVTRGKGSRGQARKPRKSGGAPIETEPPTGDCRNLPTLDQLGSTPAARARSDPEPNAST